MWNSQTGSLPTGNRLLDNLSEPARSLVMSDCESVQLIAGEVLDTPGEPMAHVYFPSGSAISCLLPMDTGHVVEVSLVGQEGLHGATVARGRSRSLVRAEVRLGGAAWRMTTEVFRRCLARIPALAKAIDRYLGVIHAQLVQASGCNRFHRVDQRVARWLLMTADRARTRTFPLTHELLGYTLGVRRVGVTNAASEMQKRRLIAYSRGVVTILDRKGLERAACPCYRVDLDSYARAMPTPASARSAGRRSA